ncbi:MAG: transcription elongation factor GreA [bacterium]|nr:transcription elongation factor GreA [bacterium]MDD7616128.1 transcription elongation factor GreA [bacterium]MDY4159228.1 transcription elongation factor GreA [Candidatus Onthovivens sp.]
MATGREIYLTQEGLDDIKKQYRQLVDVERVEVIEQLQAARAMGDLSENADYDSARNRQAEIEGKIAELENIIANAVVVESNKQSKTIGISNIIRILDLSENEEYTVKIVSSIESDPLSDPSLMKISNVCPLGEALINAKLNDVVTVKTAKPYQVKVLEIK